MKPWRIQCWCGSSLISKIIRFRTWSHFSHVSITNDEWLWEATTPLVRKVKPGVAYEEMKGVPVAELCFRDALSNEAESCLEAFLDVHVGDRYNYNELLRFMVRDDEAKPSDKWICSKYISAACMSAGRDIQQRILLHKIDPGQVFTSPTLYLLRFGLYEPTPNGQSFLFNDWDIEKAFGELVYTTR
jgi:hypothetical protein